MLDGKKKIKNEIELAKSARNQQRAKADPTPFHYKQTEQSVTFAYKNEVFNCCNVFKKLYYAEQHPKTKINLL